MIGWRHNRFLSSQLVIATIGLGGQNRAALGCSEWRLFEEMAWASRNSLIIGCKPAVCYHRE
jgi:hypothetical protein